VTTNQTQIDKLKNQRHETKVIRKSCNARQWVLHSTSENYCDNLFITYIWWYATTVYYRFSFVVQHTLMVTGFRTSSDIALFALVPTVFFAQVHCLTPSSMCTLYYFLRTYRLRSMRCSGVLPMCVSAMTGCFPHPLDSLSL
jgi:hypothetical protein